MHNIHDENRLDDDPRLIELCTNCTHVSCRGDCEEVKALRRSISPFGAVYRHLGKKYELNGESKPLAQWAKEYRISDKLLRKRIKEGMPLEQALQMKVRNKNKEYEAFGRIQGVNAWAEEYNINPFTVYARIERGMTMEEALTSPVRKSGGRRKRGSV